MRLTTHDTSVSTGAPSASLTESTLRDAADRAAKEGAETRFNASYYQAKERLCRNLADLHESGELREEILRGISSEAREVISASPPRPRLEAAVARLEVVIAIRGTPLYAEEA